MEHTLFYVAEKDRAIRYKISKWLTWQAKTLLHRIHKLGVKIIGLKIAGCSYQGSSGTVLYFVIFS